jgi:hypothetical protein
MKTSDGLGGAGRALWEAVTRGLPQGFALDERETAQPDLAPARPTISRAWRS